MDARKTTLLDAIWAAQGDEASVIEALGQGTLELTGNFKGQEAMVAAQAKED